MPGPVVKTAGWLLQSMASATNAHAQGDGVEVPGNPWFRFHGCDGWEIAKGLREFGEDSPVLPPVPNWAAWNGSDTVAQFLNHYDDYPNWYGTSGDLEVMGYAVRPASPTAPSSLWFSCIVADWQLPWVAGRMADPLQSLARLFPPIWPGADLVQFGSPVSIDRTFRVEVPCNGLIVQLTEVPPTMYAYDWGDLTQHPRAGYLTFVNDYGAVEDVQPFTFESEVVCPRLVRLASGAYGRAREGVAGLVTPWTYLVP